ncbi:MAG: response regulator, partial [Planctomycetota bacterium]
HVDGYEALRELKNHPETADIPVILLTGKSTAEDIAEGWNYDIEFYMTKPYVVEDLLEITERILASRDELAL